MKKIFLTITCVIIGLIITLVLMLKVYMYQESKKFIEVPVPHFTSDEQGTPRHLLSEKVLLSALIENEEYFSGTVTLRHLDYEGKKVEIIIQNNYIADDSTTARENYIIAEKKGQEWLVVQSKIHWKCRSMMFLDYWTTNACS